MARTASKKTKTTPKPAVQAPTRSKVPVSLEPATQPIPPPVIDVDIPSQSAEEDADSDSDSDGDGGVDEEGMAKLMELLGEDGLDDVAEQQLSELGLDEADVEDSEDDENESESEEEEEETDEEGEETSDGESANEDQPAVNGPTAAETNESSQGDDDDEDAPLDEISDVDEDAVPRQKVVINNELALKRIRETIELGDDMPWTETLAFTVSEPLDIPNADDDLNRELAFYKQALSTANTARGKFLAAKLPFSRPPDYFAEMVKSDSHMERIRQRLLDERAGIQKSEAAKKQRELKKIGKQVQVEKIKEREKSKKALSERVKGLKRKRGGAMDADQDDEAFDVAVENVVSDRPAKRPTISRAKRDAKFGFGGPGTKGRRGKQNTKESSESFGFRNGTGREASRGGRGGARGRGRGGGRGGTRGSSKRPGKSRRQAGRA